MKKVTHLGDGSTAVIYCIIALMIQKNYSLKIGNLLILSIGISQFIVHSMKRFINRERPYINQELIFFDPKPTCEYSLPSGHTACAITVALAFSFYFSTIAFLFWGIGSLVSLSRVILGYHYPTDIIIGALISFICHYISLLYLNLI
ncbi:MAG TPA: phosphatase PAP2 family protein [Clostridia bacterium]|nr:phosphatase PAP2 family protein [Clostridia bacterium]